MSGKAFLIVWAVCSAGLFGWLFSQGQVASDETLPMVVGCAAVGLVPAALLAGVVRSG